MKVLISAVGKEKTDDFDLRFGRGEFFQIIDTEAGDIKVLENQGKKSDHGAGIGASQQVIDENIDVLITGHLGPNAFEILEDSNIELFSAKGGTVEEVLEKFKSGKLEKIEKAGKSHKNLK